MALQWASFEMSGTTGCRLIADLPAVEVGNQPIRKSLSTYDTITAALQLTPDPVDPSRAQPQNWERAIEEGASVIACWDDTDDQRAIQWAGWVSVPVRDFSSDAVTFTLVTLEGYLDRVNVGDATYGTTWGRNAIVADMLTNWVAVNAPHTVPLQISYTGAGPKPVEALVWQNTDNKTVLDRLTQLIAQLGGQFTIGWAWSTDHLSIIPTLYIADRVGTAAPAGLDPVVTFEAPGVITGFTQTRDYSNGKGANKVVPYSSGQGATTPFGAPVLAADFAGRPVFEYRYQPAPSISPTALAQYAAQAIKILAPGSRSVTMTCTRARQDGRRLGVDWRLGDDIGYRIAATDANGRPVLAFPGGTSGVGQCIAYEITDTTFTPILAEATIYVDSGA